MSLNKDRTSRNRNSLGGNASGFSLLEQCAVFPVLLIFILGTIDVTNLLRAFSAMQQGVKTALRCASPTDALCTTPPEAPVGLFEVTKTSADPLYFGYNFRYSGEASTLQRPTYTWPNPSATVLDSSNTPVQGYTGQADAFNSLANIGYNARIATFPTIVGNNPRDPSFKLANNANYPAPAQFSGVQLFVPASGRSDNGDSIIQLQSPPLNSSLPCVPIKNPSAPVSLGNIQINKRCEESWDWDNQSNPPETYKPLRGKNELSDFTYVVIHALGSSVSPVGTLGKVILTLEWSTINSQGTKINHSRDLGGSLLDGTGENHSTNFYPRGAPLSYVDPDIRAHDEFELHQAIKMQFGVNYKLNFRLIRLSGSGSITWNGGKVNVYQPFYKSRTDENLRCQSPLSINQIRTNQGCATAPQALPHEFILGLSPVGQAIASVPVGGCYVSAQEAKYELGADTVSMDLSTSCGPRKSICPDNKGVSNIAGQDAFDACPVNAYGITRDNFRNFGVTYSERTELLDPVSLTRNSCNETLPNVSDEYGEYSKLNPGQMKLTYSDLSISDTDGQPTDPAVIKETPEYSCSDFPIWSETYDFQNDSVPNTSLFKGERQDLGCSWQHQLEDEASRLRDGKHEEAYFRANREILSGSRYQLTGAPLDACITYTTAFGNDRDITSLGTFEAGRFPAQCYTEGSQCAAQFVGYTPGNTQAHLNSAMADKMGMDELQAAFPSARACPPGQANCANISVQIDDVDTTLALAKATVTVPVSLLFNRAVTLTYSDRQRLESTFSK